MNKIISCFILLCDIQVICYAACVLESAQTAGVGSEGQRFSNKAEIDALDISGGIAVRDITTCTDDYGNMVGAQFILSTQAGALV